LSDPLICRLYQREASASRLSSGFFDLTEFQFHWRRPTENKHGHLQATFFVIDFFDHAVEIVEGAVDDTHHLARFENRFRLGSITRLTALQNRFRFSVR